AARPWTRRAGTWALALGAAAVVVGGALYLRAAGTSPSLVLSQIMAGLQAQVQGGSAPTPAPPPAESTAAAPPTAPAGPSPTVDPARVLFADTFDDPAAHPWPASPEPSRYVFQHDAGEYVIRKLDPSAALVAPIEVPGTFGDASVAVDARLTGDQSGRYVSIDCRLVEEATPGREVSGYRLSVAPGQQQFSRVRFDRSRPVTLLS